MSGVLESGDTVAEAIRPTLDKFVTGAAPYLQKVTDELYEQLLYGVQDYLRENGEWNIGQEIDRCRTIEADNRQLRDRNADLLAALQEARLAILSNHRPGKPPAIIAVIDAAIARATASVGGAG